MKRQFRRTAAARASIPEETLAAFRGCAENPDVQVDYFEFDLHMTADDVLVLSHDATLDRVSDAAAVFGAENVLVRDKTLAELKELNMAAQFVSGAGEAPYADLRGDAVPDELRILSLDEVLDYLTAVGRLSLHHRDQGWRRRRSGRGGSALCDAEQCADLLDRVIVGSFRDEVADYITANYPDMHRSASPGGGYAVLFCCADSAKRILPVPMTCSSCRSAMRNRAIGINLGTTTVINFAHAT